MDDKTKQVLYRFVLGTVIVEIPVLTAWLQVPGADPKILISGLLGGLAGAVEKYLTTPEGGNMNPVIAPPVG